MKRDVAQVASGGGRENTMNVGMGRTMDVKTECGGKVEEAVGRRGCPGMAS